MNIINWGHPLFSLDGRAYYIGPIDRSTTNGKIIGVGATANFTSPPQVLAADENRRSLTKEMQIKIQNYGTPVNK